MNSLIEDNLTCLKQGLTLLSQLDDSAYSASVEQCYGSSIGGHMRHNVDHYYSLLKGVESGEIDYDARLRDPRIENEAACAIEALTDILDGLPQLSDADLEKRVRVKMDCGSDESSLGSESTVRRELQFLMSHTVHHYALIAVMATLQGIRLPSDFGVAPSTLKHRQRISSGCAQ